MEATAAGGPGGGEGGARRGTPSISVVVPVFEEEAGIAAWLRAIAARIAELTDRSEIVVVNDGSRDGTRAEVLAVAAACRVRYLELSRNFGKEAALSAGLEAAAGEVVLLIDGDGQHPLAVVGEMLARWRDGYEMVYGVRTSRADERAGKRLGAALFYRVLAWGAPIEIPPDAGDFRLMDRKVVDALRGLTERTRLMKGLYAWVGFRSVGVPYEVQPRTAGRSSFDLRRLVRLALTGITSFTTLPLHAVSLAGFLVSAAALGYGGWVVVDKLLFDIAVPGYPTIVASIMFFSGVQLLSIGLIGQYLGRVFDEVKRRPNFIVADAVDQSPLGLAPRAAGAPPLADGAPR